MYDEADVLPMLVHRLRGVLDGLPGLDGAYEVVAVDDGSRDATPVLLQRHLRDWPQLRVVRLRTNAGHQAAISAGLTAARGDWVVTLDADLQDPPEVLAEMLTTAEAEEVDVVYGVRTDRRTDSLFKRQTARAFYATMRAAGARDLPSGAGDYRLMSRATVDAVNALPEAHRVLRLVVPSLGFPSATVGYRRDERAAGRSKYPVARMVRLSVDALTGFSLAPLRLATWFGVGGFLAAVVLLGYALVAKLQDHTVAGWTSTVAIVAAVGGVQLLCLGILGEYVGRIYSSLQGRPTYYVAYDSLRPGTDRDGALPPGATPPEENRPATGAPGGPRTTVPR
jgi:polyisoprenyl-phosphate glycosyltransferase